MMAGGCAGVVGVEGRGEFDWGIFWGREEDE